MTALVFGNKVAVAAPLENCTVIPVTVQLFLMNFIIPAVGGHPIVNALSPVLAPVVTIRLLALSAAVRV